MITKNIIEKNEIANILAKTTCLFWLSCISSTVYGSENAFKVDFGEPVKIFTKTIMLCQ